MKTKLIVFTTILLINISLLLSAPDYWTRKADFGGKQRDQPCGFSIGNKGYVGTDDMHSTVPDLV